MDETMNCTVDGADLDAYLDDALDAERRARFEAHAADCASCRARLARARTLARALAELPVPPPPPGFEARVLAGARVVQRPPRIVAAGFVAAFAASVLTLIYTGLMVGPPKRDSVDPLPVVEMTLDERRTVNLVFAADMPLEEVSLQVALPPGVDLLGIVRALEGADVHPHLARGRLPRERRNRHGLPAAGRGPLQSASSEATRRCASSRSSARMTSRAIISYHSATSAG
jgi:anti-sigma factor RsiW